jgi:transcription antitermination factor NusB
VSSRRKARETALRILYLCESRDMTADEAFAEMAAIDCEMEKRAGEPDVESLKPFALGIAGEGLEYARSLARSIEASREKFNGLIRSVLKNWELERVARIDRIILWIALAEMGSVPEIPPAVTIDEAIELARKYSSHKSPGFVNGILDAIARNLNIIQAPRDTGGVKKKNKERVATDEHR